MPGPEQVKERLKGAVFGIVLNPNDLGVSRGFGTDVLVRRIVGDPLCVSNLCLSHPREPLKRKLHAPEASGGELGKVVSRRRRVVVGSLSDRRRIRTRLPAWS